MNWAKFNVPTDLQMNSFRRSSGTVFSLVVPVIRFVLSKLPTFLVAGLLFGVTKKLLYPFYVETKSWEDSQKEKDYEARESSEWMWRDTFKDVGGEGMKNFRTTRARARGEYFRRQQQQQQQQEYYQDGQRRQEQRQQEQRQQHQQQQRTKQSSNNSKVQFDFDTTDPYEVLRMDKKKPLTKQSLSQAFRREMMKWHPDRFQDATAERKNYATERTKLITNHYTQLRKRF